jgi:hypothetical protein
LKTCKNALDEYFCQAIEYFFIDFLSVFNTISNKTCAVTFFFPFQQSLSLIVSRKPTLGSSSVCHDAGSVLFMRVAVVSITALNCFTTLKLRATKNHDGRPRSDLCARSGAKAIVTPAS